MTGQMENCGRIFFLFMHSMPSTETLTPYLLAEQGSNLENCEHTTKKLDDIIRSNADIISSQHQVEVLTRATKPPLKTQSRFNQEEEGDESYHPVDTIQKQQQSLAAEQLSRLSQGSSREEDLAFYPSNFASQDSYHPPSFFFFESLHCFSPQEDHFKPLEKQQCHHQRIHSSPFPNSNKPLPFFEKAFESGSETGWSTLDHAVCALCWSEGEGKRRCTSMLMNGGYETFKEPKKGQSHSMQEEDAFSAKAHSEPPIEMSLNKPNGIEELDGSPAPNSLAVMDNVENQHFYKKGNDESDKPVLAAFIAIPEQLESRKTSFSMLPTASLEILEKDSGIALVGANQKVDTHPRDIATFCEPPEPLENVVLLDAIGKAVEQQSLLQSLVKELAGEKRVARNHSSISPRTNCSFCENQDSERRNSSAMSHKRSISDNMLIVKSNEVCPVDVNDYLPNNELLHMNRDVVLTVSFDDETPCQSSIAACNQLPENGMMMQKLLPTPPYFNASRRSLSTSTPSINDNNNSDNNSLVQYSTEGPVPFSASSSSTKSAFKNPLLRKSSSKKSSDESCYQVKMRGDEAHATSFEFSTKPTKSNGKLPTTATLLTQKSLATKSSVSIGGLMERFTSRRQHSDSKLHRSLMNPGLHQPTTNHLKLESPDPSTFNNTSSTVNSNRRSFKWKSLFSTPKVSGTTNSSCTQPNTPLSKKQSEISNYQVDKPNVMLRKYSKQAGDQTRSKKISLNHSSGKSNSPLAPLLEDGTVFTTTFNNSTQQDRPKPGVVYRSCSTSTLRHSTHLPPTNGSSKEKEGMQRMPMNESRPLSLIESVEYNQIMLQRQAYRVDEADNKKLADFLQLHFDDLQASDEEEEDLDYRLLDKNMFKNEDPVVPKACYAKTGVSCNPKYYSLNRRTARGTKSKPLPSASTGKLCRRTSLSTANNPHLALTTRTFSPPCLSPANSSTTSASAGRIRKRRMNNRRRSIHASMMLNGSLETQIEEVVNRKENNEEDDKTKKALQDDPSSNGVVMRKPKKKSSNKNLDVLYSTNNANSTDLGRREERAPEKDKKRESKTNSVILGTLLSIRQKKKPKDNRALANVFPSSNAPTTCRKDSTSATTSADTARRSTTFSSLEPKTEGLPDVLLTVLGSGGSGKLKDISLPNALLASSPGYDNLSNFHFPTEDEPQPQLVKQKWKDLDLWSDDPAASWSLKHGDIGHLSASEKKKQNIIYEVFTTEKHHCQVIVFLQQAYQVELQKKEIVSEAQMKQLIPDVLDSLLDFHLRILRRMRDRLEESKVVGTIGDIIMEEFDGGDFKTAAINAYTTFCLAREESYKVYSKYMERFPRFKNFFSFFERNPDYKGRSFKSCLLLIAQRLTKYPILMEQIAKYETGVHKEVCQKAHNAVKSFALRVDKELWAYELNRRWEGVRRTMDKSSVGQLLGSPFTYDDLVAHNPADRRKCLSIGTVYWPSVSGQKIELCMILFNDIVVFLQNKSGVFQFFSQKDHASVIPLHTALIREMERTNEVMLIILAKKKPDMCRLFFANKNEMHQWVQTIKSARLIAPKYVRTANGTLEVESSKPAGDEAGEVDPDETAYNERITKWQKRLELLFTERMKQEELLKDYFDERMKFFDSIRRHLRDFPIKTPRSGSALATAKSRENRDIERLKNVLQTRFSDLRNHRRSTLDQLIETSQKARDSDLASFFDDLFELGQEGQPSSSSNDSSATYSDENEENSTNKKRGNKPRRARTYHGTADSQKSSSSTRRHTTVPKVSSEDFPSGEDDASFNDQVDDDIRKLPLRVGAKARKAATDLIRENVSIRIENNKLRKEIALQDLHIASLRAQRKPIVETSEKLESLRQKYDEIQRQERDFKIDYEKRMDNLKAKQEQLDTLETTLKQREAQIETVYTTFTTTSAPQSTSDRASKFSSTVSSESNLHRPLSSTMPGKMPTFRSGSAIHELNTVNSIKSGSLTDRPFSTAEKSSNSDIYVMPRHLVVKTETKLADKRRHKK